MQGRQVLIDAKILGEGGAWVHPDARGWAHHHYAYRYNRDEPDGVQYDYRRLYSIWTMYMATADCRAAANAIARHHDLLDAVEPAVDPHRT